MLVLELAILAIVLALVAGRVPIMSQSSSLASSSSGRGIRGNGYDQLVNDKPGVNYLGENRVRLGRLRYWSHILECAVSGSMACALMHSMTVPLDVLKTRMQIDTHLQRLQPLEAVREIARHDGKRAFASGLSATFAGYMLQGGLKFGLYEHIKMEIISGLRKRGVSRERIDQVRLPIWLTGSAVAEMVACFALCPLEVCRIATVMDPALRDMGLPLVMRGILKRQGVTGIFKGLPLVMFRQVPYTCVKLASYELFKHFFVERHLRKLQSSDLHVSAKQLKRAMLKPLTFSTQLCTGALAGATAAFVSHPADSLLSKFCGGSQTASKCLTLDTSMDMFHALRDMGLSGAFTGVGTRVVMAAFLSAGQFLLYEHTRSCLTKSTVLRPWERKKGHDI